MAKAHRIPVPQLAVQGCSIVVGTVTRGIDGLLRVHYQGVVGAVECDVLSGTDPDAFLGQPPALRRALVAVPPDGGKPILLGGISSGGEVAVQMPSSNRHPDTEVRIDGERVVLEAKRELVLRCGPSEIVLNRDGKVIVRGRNVVTRAAETNSIKGADVKIN